MQLVGSAGFIIFKVNGEIMEVGLVINVDKRHLILLVIDGALWISYLTTVEVIYHVSKVIGEWFRKICSILNISVFSFMQSIFEFSSTD